jgi:hypothetical protein
MIHRIDEQDANRLCRLVEEEIREIKQLMCRMEVEVSKRPDLQSDGALHTMQQVEVLRSILPDYERLARTLGEEDLEADHEYVARELATRRVQEMDREELMYTAEEALFEYYMNLSSEKLYRLAGTRKEQAP